MLHAEVVEELAESMAQRGHLQAIAIRPRENGGYWLIAGWHRLEAAKKLEWENIRCTIFEGLSGDAAELAEIDENLIRADLSPAERALHKARRKALYEKLHPETKQGGDRKSAKAKSKSQNENLKSFVKDAAKKTAKASSTIARDVTRANKVVILAEITGTSLDQGDELDALAGLSADEQQKLAERAKAGEKVSAKTRAKQVRRQARERQLAEKTAAAAAALGEEPPASLTRHCSSKCDLSTAKIAAPRIIFPAVQLKR